MAVPTHLSYIEEQLRRGISREIITNSFLEAGWSQEQIDQAFAQLSPQATVKKISSRLFVFIILIVLGILGVGGGYYVFSDKSRLTPPEVVQQQDNEITNFQEIALLGANDTYKGIQITFTLAAKQAGTYQVNGYIERCPKPDYGCQIVFWSSPQTVTFEQAVPQELSFFLEPFEPYCLDTDETSKPITIRLTSGAQDLSEFQGVDGKKWNTLITANADVKKNWEGMEGFFVPEVILDNQLLTKGYACADFKLEDQDITFEDFERILEERAEYELEQNILTSEKFRPAIISNYTIENFSEGAEPAEETGKYAGIVISFDLTVQKAGRYGIEATVTPPGDDSIRCSECLFKYRYPSVRQTFEANVPQHISIFLEPQHSLTTSQVDGPYDIGILIEPSEDTAYWVRGMTRDDGVFITGDQTITDDRGKFQDQGERTHYGLRPFLYNEILKTAPYKYTDFVVKE